jgi:dipeptidase E
MRLYLSSFGYGRHVAQLLRLLDGDTNIAVIDHALDAAPTEVIRTIHAREMRALTAAGLRAELIDLRTRSGLHVLRHVGAVWVTGGNVFVLRDALATTGADDLVRDRLAAGSFVYGGYSAGACVLGPSLDGYDMVDDPTLATQLRWDGLAVLDRPLVPHITSPRHPESERCDALSARLSDDGTRHWRLRDGDALIIDGQQTTFLTDDPAGSTSSRSRKLR